MRVSSRQILFVLLTVLTLITVAQFVTVSGMTPAMLDAMAPGDATVPRWRLLALELFGASIVSAGIAFFHVRRREASAGIIAAAASVLSAFGMLSMARMIGRPSVFDFSFVWRMAFAGAAVWVAQRDVRSGIEPRYVSRDGIFAWIAAFLQAAALFVVVMIAHNARWPEAPLLAMLLATPQWIVAWRFSTSESPGRGDAAAATALGTLGVITLVLVTIMPVAYVGLLGPALLGTPWGVAFYTALILATWLFLHLGAKHRTRLAAPPRDRRIAIAAAVIGLPMIAALGSLLAAILP